MPDPNLQVSLLTPDEAPLYVQIRHQVFKSTVNQILYSRARGEASQKTLDRVAEETRDNIINKGYLFLKCVDTSTNEMIAGARWRYVAPKTPGATERTWEEVEAAFAERLQPYDETEPEMLDALLDLFNQHKRAALGNRPYFCLDTLATLPQHERRGAGSMLVRWGCDKADEQGVQAYLEASPMGAPMYARHGFVAMEGIELDLRRWGGEEVMRFIVSIGVMKFDWGVLTNLWTAYAETDEGRAGRIAGRKADQSGLINSTALGLLDHYRDYHPIRSSIHLMARASPPP
jgi:predicted N-acetyltransferase YhbS